jgi:uncharacterized membrane protein YqjE
LRALGPTLVDILRTRLDLLAIEATQMQHRFRRLAGLGGLVLLSLLVCVQLLALLVVAYWWDTPYRLPTIAVLAVLFATGAMAITRAMRAAPSALDGTLRSLAADLEALA